MNSIVNLVQNMAEQFDSTKAYTAGDYVMYEGLLYLFASSHAAGAFNADEVIPVTLADVMKGAVNSNLALKIKTGTIAKATTIDTIECGFKPLAIIFTSVGSGVNNVAYIADEANDTYYMYGVLGGGASKKMSLGNTDSYCIRNVTDTGFTVAHTNYEFTYVAIGR